MAQCGCPFSAPHGSRCAPRDSGPLWFATPSTWGSCTPYSWPVSRRTILFLISFRPSFSDPVSGCPFCVLLYAGVLFLSSFFCRRPFRPFSVLAFLSTNRTEAGPIRPASCCRSDSLTALSGQRLVAASIGVCPPSAFTLCGHGAMRVSLLCSLFRCVSRLFRTHVAPHHAAHGLMLVRSHLIHHCQNESLGGTGGWGITESPSSPTSSFGGF
jgi:hypothetical protein